MFWILACWGRSRRQKDRTASLGTTEKSCCSCCSSNRYKCSLELYFGIVQDDSLSGGKLQFLFPFVQGYRNHVGLLQNEGGGESNSSQWMNKKIKQAQLSEGSSDRMQNYTVWTLSVPLPPGFCWSPPSKAWTWCLCPLCRTKCSGALQWDLVPSRRRSASSPWHGRRTALHPQPPPPLPYFLWANMIKCFSLKNCNY